MFNVLTVAVLLPVEIAFQYLERVSGYLIEPISSNNPNAKEPEMLNAITKPLTEAIIQIDKNILDTIASSNVSIEAGSLVKRICKKKFNDDDMDEVLTNSTLFSEKGMDDYKCNSVFASVFWPDWVIGVILLILSLILLSGCLIGMVKILSSIFQGPVAILIQKIGKLFSKIDKIFNLIGKIFSFF